jgi:hypothetical protein
MEDQLISFETAKLAKKHGFELSMEQRKTTMFYASNGRLCDKVYDFDDVCLAPTQSLLQRWLREEHQIALYLKPSNDSWDMWSIYIDDGYGRHHLTEYVVVRGWENALEEGLKLSFEYINGEV